MARAKGGVTQVQPMTPGVLAVDWTCVTRVPISQGGSVSTGSAVWLLKSEGLRLISQGLQRLNGEGSY